MTWISFLHYGTKKQTVVLQTGGSGWREHLCAHYLVIFQVRTHEFSMRLLFYFSSGARVDCDTNGSAPDLAESWLTCHLVGFSKLLAPPPAWRTARHLRAGRRVRFTLRRRLIKQFSRAYFGRLSHRSYYNIVHMYIISVIWQLQKNSLLSHEPGLVEKDEVTRIKLNSLIYEVCLISDWWIKLSQ